MPSTKRPTTAKSRYRPWTHRTIRHTMSHPRFPGFPLLLRMDPTRMRRESQVLLQCQLANLGQPWKRVARQAGPPHRPLPCGGRSRWGVRAGHRAQSPPAHSRARNRRRAPDDPVDGAAAQPRSVVGASVWIVSGRRRWVGLQYTSVLVVRRSPGELPRGGKSPVRWRQAWSWASASQPWQNCWTARAGLSTTRFSCDPCSVGAARPDELDDDAHQSSGHHDDLARCGPSKQLNDAGML